MSPLTGDRRFESTSLQRRGRNEPSQADAGCPTDAGGAVDAMHDSFMPLGGMVLILNSSSTLVSLQPILVLAQKIANLARTRQ